MIQCRVRIAILKYSVPKPSEICMSEEQLQRFFDFIMGDDLDFYEEDTVNLTEEEREMFFRDNRDFMTEDDGEYDVECDKLNLVKERMFEEILRKIGELENGR